MATDFRSGKEFPRRGRETVSGFAWFARVADKARAAAAGTLSDYIYPCPMDVGVFERWGITAADFDEAVAANRDDASLLAWLDGRVDDAHRAKANAWVLDEKSANLDRQDREEGVLA